MTPAPGKQPWLPGSPPSLPRLKEACAVALVAVGEKGKHWRLGLCWLSMGRAASGSGQAGWTGLTFTLPAFPLVAWLAEAFVGFGRVLADGIDVAVICALGALIHVDCPCVWGKHW